MRLIASIPSRIGRSDFLGGALVFLSGLGFGLVPLLRGRTFYHWDNAQQHLAQTAFLRDWLRQGTWPQWWPDVGLGVPTVAEGQSAHLYPFRVAIAGLFDPAVAMCIEVGLYLGLAGLATYAFLRVLDIRAVSSVFGAVSHMFGGASLVFLGNMALYRSLWLLPVLMLLAEVAATRRTGVLVTGVSVAFGLQVLSGHPMFAIVTGVTTAAYLGARVIHQSWQVGESLPAATLRFGTSMAFWGVALVLGLGVGAAQLVPTLAHTPFSVRAGGLDFEYATRGLTAGVAWMGQMVLPYAYALGELREVPTVWGSTFNQNPHRGYYLGALVPLLLVLALVRCLRRDQASSALMPLVAAFLVAFVLALGGDAPLFPALRSLPGMDGLRYPQRFLAVCSLFMAAIAAIGLDGLLKNGSEKECRWARWIALAYALFVVTTALGFLVMKSQLDLIGIPSPNFGGGVAASVMLALAASGLALIGTGSKGAPRLLGAACVVFAVGDLLVYRQVSGYAATAEVSEVVTPPPAAAFVADQEGDFRVLSLQSGDGGALPLDVLREMLVADLPYIWGLETTDVFFSLMLARQFVVQESIVWELSQNPGAAERLASFLGAMNVRYVIARPGTELPGLLRVYEAERVVVWENPQDLGRAFLVYAAVPEKIEHRFEWDARSSMLRLPAFRRMSADWEFHADDAVIVDNLLESEVDFSRTGIVDTDVDLGLAPTGSGVLTLLESRPDERSYRVEADGAALLVWSESFAPGWSATVDGAPSPMYRTDYLLTGVRVPGGSHEVVFRFRTQGLRTGLVVTVGSLLVLALLIVRWPGGRTLSSSA